MVVVHAGSFFMFLFSFFYIKCNQWPLLYTVICWNQENVSIPLIFVDTEIVATFRWYHLLVVFMRGTMVVMAKNLVRWMMRSTVVVAVVCWHWAFWQFLWSQEMLGAIAGVPVGPGLVIHFYGKKRFETKPLFIAADSFPICAEDVCKRCAVHLTESLGRFYPQNKNVIGPAWLPIFGLYGANHQQQLWVPEYHVFEPSASPGQESFYFRIKVRFSKDKLKYYFGIISDYLYLQVWYE